ncbi:MAG TPA: cytochrome c peroxidase [Burkholderiales bacterium]
MLFDSKRASRALVLIVVFISMGRVGTADDRLGLPPQPIPFDNPLTSEKVELGRSLFHDTRFSADGSISCASCHLPKRLYTDGRTVGVGITGKQGTRNAPTVVNAGYYSSLFWDGRAASLEEQAKGPLVNPIEHGLKNYDPILKIVRTDAAYAQQFNRAFGLAPADITINHVAMAIASYERTLVVGDSPFDRYQYGGDKRALSPSAIEGLKVFTGKGKCSVCHVIGKSDAIFTDNRYHNIGVGLRQIQGRLTDVVNAVIEAKLRGKSVDHSVLTAENISQLGRFAITLNPTDIATFRTPSLRNVALTAPYMHDGSLKTLDDVVEFYGKGGSSSTLQHPTIRKLRLTKTEERQLVDFMESLTSTKHATVGNKPVQTAVHDSGLRKVKTRLRAANP